MKIKNSRKKTAIQTTIALLIVFVSFQVSIFHFALKADGILDSQNVNLLLVACVMSPLLAMSLILSVWAIFRQIKGMPTNYLFIAFGATWLIHKFIGVSSPSSWISMGIGTVILFLVVLIFWENHLQNKLKN